MTPTEEQAAIIGAVLDKKSIIVNALAGAAKTSTIAMAGQALVGQGRDLSGYLALAFNVKIRAELASRLPFECQTLNACGLRAWTRVVGRLQVDGEKMAKIRRRLNPDAPWELSRLVSMAKLNGLVPEARQAMGQGILPDTRETWEGLADDLDIDLVKFNPRTKQREDHLQLCRQMLVASIDEAYKTSIDFDDQVYMPTCFGGQFQKYECIFVDEAQDLSPLNHLMLKRMAPKQLVAVGDPLQSIYAFRGADTQSMPKLQEDWGLDELTLSVCFRCSKAVAEFASRWAHNIQSPEWAQEGQVLEHIEHGDWGGWNFDDLPQRVTVLCRNNAPLIGLALRIFRKRRIAFANSRAETSMLSALRKICGYKKDLSLDTIEAKIAASLQKRLETEDEKKHERIIDEHSALDYCLAQAKAEGKDYMGLEALISSLFQAKDAEIVFATGHGAKGLEWDNVLHLDSFRLPSKFARSEEQLQQEANIHYVISTRAKGNLYHANLDQYSEE